MAVLVVEIEHALVDLGLPQRRRRLRCDECPIRLRVFSHGSISSLHRFAVEEAAEARDGLGDLEPAKGRPEHGLIAVHNRLVEAPLDVLDGVDHARGRAAQEVTVSLGPAVFHREVGPLPWGDPEILVAAALEPSARS